MTACIALWREIQRSEAAQIERNVRAEDEVDTVVSTPSDVHE